MPSSLTISQSTPEAIEAGQPRQIDRGFSMTAPLQHAAGLGSQRKNMARLHQVARLGFRIGQQADGLRAILGADAGGDVMRGIDRNGEVGFKTFTVIEHHPV